MNLVLCYNPIEQFNYLVEFCMSQVCTQARKINVKNKFALSKDITNPNILSKIKKQYFICYNNIS